MSASASESRADSRFESAEERGMGSVAGDPCAGLVVVMRSDAAISYVSDHSLRAGRTLLPYHHPPAFGTIQ